MLKRITELVNYADTYGASLYNITPPAYREPADYSDAVTSAWQQALESAAKSLHAIRDLEQLLTEKVKKLEARESVAQHSPG
jgi:hypothetical protein